MSREYYGARRSSGSDDVIFGGLFDHLLEKPKTDLSSRTPRRSGISTGRVVEEDDHYAWLAENLPELAAPIQKTWKPGGINDPTEKVARSENRNRNELDELPNRSSESSLSQKKGRRKKGKKKKPTKLSENPTEVSEGGNGNGGKSGSPPVLYNPVEDPKFQEIPVKTAEDVIFVDDHFSLEYVTDSGAPIFDYERKSAYETEEFNDAVAYKAVAERELRKRVGLILKNEGKALEEMKQMRREDRLASTEASRVSRATLNTFGPSSASELPASRREWSGVTFAARIARQQAALARQSAHLPEKGIVHSYRSFDPKKGFQVTSRERESVMAPLIRTEVDRSYKN